MNVSTPSPRAYGASSPTTGTRVSRLLIVGAFALVGVGCSAQNNTTEVAPHVAQEPQALIDQWGRLNSACRGGSGDNPATSKACQARGVVEAKLDAAGWCYGRPNEFGNQSDWHPRSEGCADDVPTSPPYDNPPWFIVDWRHGKCLSLYDQLGVDTPAEAAQALSTLDRPQSVIPGDHGATAIIADHSGTTLPLARGLENCAAALQAIEAAD